VPFSSNDPADYLAFAKQSAQRTEATTGFKFVKYLTGGLDEQQDSQTIYEGGDGQDPGLIYKTRHTADGSADVYVRPDTFAYLSAWAMGSGVTIASTGGVASHCYVPNSTLPALTVEQAWGGGNQIDRAIDCFITNYQLSGDAENPWKLHVEWMGGGSVYGRNGAASALSATLESGDPAMYAGGAYVIDGATSLDVRNWNFTMARDADGDLFTTGVNRRDLVLLKRNYTLNFQVIVQDPSLWQKVYYAASGGTMPQVTLASGRFHAERALTASQMVAIDVPEFRYLNSQVNSLEPDGQTLIYDVAAQPRKGATGVVQIRANITSTPTSYLL
jgi:hypothetical protein